MAMSLAGSGRKGSRRGGRRAPMAEINVTPFVDVMLVLLIIFMVTAPLLNSGVPIELPDSRASALPAENDPITLTVAPDGAIYLGDEALAAGSLPARLADIRPLADGTMPQINLRGDRAQSYGRMMAVMGELNRAGFNSIALLANDVAAAPEAIGAGGDTVPADVSAVSDGSDSEQ